MYQAIQVLRHEHEVILRVLDTAEACANAIESGRNASAQYLQDVVQFLRLYADRQHHGKEEDFLFPELVNKGMPRNGGPVGVMLMEHQVGRSHIARMAEAAGAVGNGDKTAGAQWADAALDYATLLREHISKENNILFVMAERILSPKEQQALAVKFSGVDKQKMEPGKGEYLEQMAERLIAGCSRATSSHA